MRLTTSNTLRASDAQLDKVDPCCIIVEEFDSCTKASPVLFAREYNAASDQEGMAQSCATTDESERSTVMMECDKSAIHSWCGGLGPDGWKRGGSTMESADRSQQV
jgi:hypothetical protein